MHSAFEKWQGREDTLEGPDGYRWHHIIQPYTKQSGGIVLVGFAVDAGVLRNQGRAGARQGPKALRLALANMPLPQNQNIYDAGDIVCDQLKETDLEEAQHELASEIANILSQNNFPIILGGGHEVAYGSFSGLAQHLLKENTPKIGILNLDSHFDLRMANHPNSGTPFRQMAEDCQRRKWPFHYCCLGVSAYANSRALFNRAKALNVKYRCDEEMSMTEWPAVRSTIHDFINDVDYLYLTLCLDVLPAAVAPGVSAPAPYGVSLEMIEKIIDYVAGSPKLRLADIAELNPSLDRDGQTARVAARLIARLVNKIPKNSTYNT